MGRKKNDTNFTAATQQSAAAANTATQIDTSHFSDPLRDEAKKRLDALNSNDIDAALKGMDVLDPVAGLRARTARRSPDGSAALAAPQANSDLTMLANQETEGQLAEDYGRDRVNARNTARDYWTSTGMAAEGNGIGALATKGNLQLGAAGANTSAYSAYNSRRRWYDPFLAMGNSAMSGMAAFA
jgi:hypothetical protein